MAQVNFISATKLIELLIEANRLGQMNVRVLTTNQLALGIDPLHPSSVIDLSREVVRSLEQGKDQKTFEPQPMSPLPAGPPRPHSPSLRSSRTTGKYYVEIKGNMIECRSLKEMLAKGLIAFEQHKPGTLEKLSKVRPRSKHIVAREPRHLFGKADNVEKYTERLVGDWWYGTNNSATETEAWLKRGAELSGLDWGRDVTTSL
jgi:hypothetical protein